MTVAVRGLGHGWLNPRSILRGLVAVSLTVATGVALLLPVPTAHAARILGTDGDDHIVGTDTRRGDVINAFGGDDVVSALDGPDGVFGDDGHDILDVGRGGDGVGGGSGDDTIRLGPNPALQEDWGMGGEGSDRIVGGAGMDIIRGGPGPDVLHGRSGPDTIAGDPGIDLLRGETGNDRFFVNRGADTAIGGPDDDTFFVRPDGRPDQIMCGPGRDTVWWGARHEMHDRAMGCERFVKKT
jgi:Ca2+-binding RTX toxin-like protein